MRGLLAASWLGLVAGCGGGGGGTASPGAPGSSADGAGAGKGPRLVFISNSNSDWWGAVEKGMKDGGEKFGARVELRRNQGQPEGQIKLLEDVMSLPDVKGVAVSVLEAESPGIADKMRELRKAGKVVIAVDSDGQADTRSAYIGTNNRKAGGVAGKAAAALRPKGGKTVVFVGTAAAANAIERREGFFAGAGKAFEQTEIFEDGGDVSLRAASNVQNAITKYPDVGVLLGLWSYNAPRIAEEVGKSPELRKKVTVVTFDLDEQAVVLIEKGLIDASVCQNPYEMGYQGVRLLKALVEDDKATVGEMLPGKATEIDTGVRVIVPSTDSPVKGDNVIDIKSMKEWLTSKGLKSS
ncbi:MAG: substrate-binding domain-containing protein [Planctomycetia bacterium]|nr:substrate-binding domain-containing protein [Planctomycetia bacterium]